MRLDRGPGVGRFACIASAPMHPDTGVDVHLRTGPGQAPPRGIDLEFVHALAHRSPVEPGGTKAGGIVLEGVLVGVVVYFDGRDTGPAVAPGAILCLLLACELAFECFPLLAHFQLVQALLRSQAVFLAGWRVDVYLAGLSVTRAVTILVDNASVGLHALVKGGSVQHRRSKAEGDCREQTSVLVHVRLVLVYVFDYPASRLPFGGGWQVCESAFPGVPMSGQQPVERGLKRRA